MTRKLEKKENRKLRREEDRRAAILNAQRLKEEDGANIVEELESRADNGRQIIKILYLVLTYTSGADLLLEIFHNFR